MTRKTPRKLIAPSILSADFGRLAEEARAVESAGADLIHVDVMDGRFVPNITVGPAVVAALKRATLLPLDVHLMIAEPQRYVRDFSRAGAGWISLHAEADPHLDRAVSLIRECGARAGIAINPATPVAVVDPLLEKLDFVLVMTVNPGFGGQKFIPYCTAKVRELAKLRETRGLKFLIEIDGGVGPENAGELARVGTDVFVAGSAVFGAKDYAGVIASIRRAAS